MLVRIKFEKTGAIRFVGHLDLLRTLQKAIRRSNLPIAYSAGYSPHQIFSIAAPLAVGVESIGEYLDMKLESEYDIPSIVSLLNATMPPGIVILGAWKLDETTLPAMSAVAAAKYTVKQKNPIIEAKHIEALMNKDTLIIRKKSKKGKYNDFDLKPGIISIQLQDEDIIMTLATGSSLNVKPEMVLDKIVEMNELETIPYNFKWLRHELYQHHETYGLVPLSQV